MSFPDFGGGIHNFAQRESLSGVPMQCGLPILKASDHRRDALEHKDKRSKLDGEGKISSSAPLVISRPDDHPLIEATVRLLAKHAAWVDYTASLKGGDDQ